MEYLTDAINLANTYKDIIIKGIFIFGALSLIYITKSLEG